MESLKTDSLTGKAAAKEELIKLEAVFTPPAEGKPAQLFITARLAEGANTYSITQKKGGPLPTKIDLKESDQYKLSGPFVSHPQPDKHPEPAFDNLEVEAHKNLVVWVAPVELAAGVDTAALTIEGTVRSQVCRNGSCFPPEKVPFQATLGEAPKLPSEQVVESAPPGVGIPAPTSSFPPAPNADANVTASLPAPDSVGTYSDGQTHIELRGKIEPKVAVPGGKVTLTLTALPGEHFHVYALEERDPDLVSKPTLIVLSETSGWKATRPTADNQPVEKNSDGTISRYHEGPVSWSLELQIPSDAKPGEYPIQGMMGYQVCKDESCDRPMGVTFSALVPVDFNSAEGEIPLGFTRLKSYIPVAKAAAGNTAPTQQVASNGLNLDVIRGATAASAQEQPLWLMMGMGLLGGLILNCMPCVLPVIGLKILSFVKQSGESRGRIFYLNFWYSLGILSVFWVLASVPVVWQMLWQEKFGWGQQFGYDGFNITMAAIVFVMALSFLGVWEIPIPGFVGGSGANQIASKEGALGAFSKGILTTMLATPCSGPFLGTALGFAFAQPPMIIYVMFTAIGLGMASPYLMIGTFPKLIRFLPKPGAWMDIFKQVMGFFLLGTVVYLLYLVQWQKVIPTVGLLMGLWFAAWYIGLVPLYESLGKRLRAWGMGTVFGSVLGVGSFFWLGPIMEEKFEKTLNKEIAQRVQQTSLVASDHTVEERWKPYSEKALTELVQSGKTVVVDFTADWCLTCKTLEKTVLNTESTWEVLEKNGVVTLLADVTNFPPEESKLLEALTGGRQVPVLAIFPATNPNQPIVLQDGYTQGRLLEKLQQAGPSKNLPGNGLDSSSRTEISSEMAPPPAIIAQP